MQERVVTGIREGLRNTMARWMAVGVVLVAGGLVGEARADETPPPPKPAPPVRVEKRARMLPDGTFEGEITGGAIGGHVRIVVVGRLVVLADVKLTSGETIVLMPQRLASDAELMLSGQVPGDGPKDNLRLRGGFADSDAAAGRWDGAVGDKVGAGAWSVVRR